MTEVEWLAGNDPAAMLEWVRRGIVAPVRVSDRKLELWCLACCRLWTGLRKERLEELENGNRELSTNQWAQTWADCGTEFDKPDKPTKAVILREIIGNPFRPVRREGHEVYYGDGTHQQDYWLTPTVVGIARRIYDGRAFEAMPVLADALEDAGCEDVEILGHCRGTEVCPKCLGTGCAGRETDCGKCCPDCQTDNKGRLLLRGPHVRGCWVLDLILGKE